MKMYVLKLVLLIVLGFVGVACVVAIFDGVIEAFAVAGVIGWVWLMMWEAFIVWREDRVDEEMYMSDEWLARQSWR